MDGSKFLLVDRLCGLAQCRQVSKAVFVEEQGVPPELESLRIGKSTHFLGTYNSLPVATGRIYPCSVTTARVECVAVLREFRRRGFGTALMHAILDHVHEQGFIQATIAAQVPAIKFYDQFGFTPYGAPYQVANIPHQNMSIQF